MGESVDGLLWAQGVGQAGCACAVVVDAGCIDGLLRELQIELHPLAQVDDGVEGVRRLPHGKGACTDVKRGFHVAQLVGMQGAERIIIRQCAGIVAGVDDALQQSFLETEC